VERTLLSAAFDLDLDLAGASTIPCNTVEERRLSAALNAQIRNAASAAQTYAPKTPSHPDRSTRLLTKPTEKSNFPPK